MACLAPLILCWHLLTLPVEPADDQAVAEILLEDLVANNPLLLPRTESNLAIGFHDEGNARRMPDNPDRESEST